MNLARAASAVIGSLVALTAGAQPAPQPPKFDPAAVERGKELLVAQCGFCHGSNARGGNMGRTSRAPRWFSRTRTAGSSGSS